MTTTTTTVTTTKGLATISQDGAISFDGGSTWSYWSNIVTTSDMLAYLKREGKLVAQKCYYIHILYSMCMCI